MVDTAPEIARAVNDTLAKLHLPALSAAQITTYIGDGATTLIKRCLTRQLDGEPDPVLLEAARSLFFDCYGQIVAESHVYPNVVNGLHAIKDAGMRMACVTNKPHAFTMPLLAHCGILQYFDLVVSGDTLLKKKPEPDQILYACEQLGVPAKEVALIGDSRTDVAAARSAGCLMLAVPYGYNQGVRIASSEVDALLDNIGDILDLLN